MYLKNLPMINKIISQKNENKHIKKNLKKLFSFDFFKSSGLIAMFLCYITQQYTCDNIVNTRF